MATFAISTLGCKVNQAEEEYLRRILLSAGFNEVPFNDAADVYIVNSCTVTHLADHKSRKLARKALRTNKDCVLFLCGCAVNNSKAVDDLEGNIIYLKTQDKEKILDYIPVKYFKDKSEEKNKILSKRTRSFVKIQTGCNNQCSYCIVPYVRGYSVSKTKKEILNEIQELIDSGCNEAVLTGVNLNYYGKDLGSEFNLKNIIELIINTGIKRLRVTSLEPYNFDYDILKLFYKYPQLLKHIHLPLQHASDKILKSMNRNYTLGDYQKILNDLLNIESLNVTTDVILGFPGETEDDFNILYDFIAKNRFSKLHVFKYSKRPNTQAEKYQDQVLEEIKSDRSKKIIELGKIKEDQSLKKNNGMIHDVLAENKGKKDIYYGYTGNYLRTGILSKNDISGKIVRVKTEYVNGRLVGRTI